MDSKHEDFDNQFTNVWKRRPEIVWGAIFVIGIAIYFIARLFFTPASTPPSPEPSTQSPPLTTITNPDYVSNPAAYLVDWTGKVPSQIPNSKALWVEQIVGPTKIKVSYTVTQSGENIIELKDLSIPGLGWPKLMRLESGAERTDLIASTVYPIVGNCWSQKAQTFLEQNLLHQIVYLVSDATGWQLLSANESNGSSTDLAALVVASGYGLIPSTSVIDATYSSADVSSFPILHYPSEGKLYSDQQVASLAKRGAWGVCGGT